MTYFEPDVSSIISWARLVAELVDLNWVARRVAAAKTKKPPKVDHRHTYLYQPHEHPLIDLCLRFDRWREECMRTGRFELHESVLELSTLGKSLETVMLVPGVDRAVKRLKISDQFHAVAFEIEIAASYAERGWKIEFVEEGSNKTPDLRVARNDGVSFWVECKRRDQMTEREKRERSLWQQVERRLIGALGVKRLNFGVAVFAPDGLRAEDIDYLTKVIIAAAERGGCGDYDENTGKYVPASDPTGRYGVVATRIAAPDQLIEANTLGFDTNPKPSHVTMLCEMRREEDGRTFMRNPMSYAYVGQDEHDRVSGILDSLRAAVRQLPESGPGVVQIRIADNAWQSNLSDAFQKAEQLLKGELSGDHNRRVNQVTVMTRVFEKLKKGSLEGLAYRPVILGVQHSNPRFRDIDFAK